MVMVRALVSVRHLQARHAEHSGTPPGDPPAPRHVRAVWHVRRGRARLVRLLGWPHKDKLLGRGRQSRGGIQRCHFNLRELILLRARVLDAPTRPCTPVRLLQDEKEDGNGPDLAFGRGAHHPRDPDHQGKEKARL